MKKYLTAIALILGSITMVATPAEAVIGGCVVNYDRGYPNVGLLRCSTNYNTAPYYTQYRLAIRCGGGPNDSTTTVRRSSYGTLHSTVSATCPTGSNSWIMNHWIEFA